MAQTRLSRAVEISADLLGAANTAQIQIGIVVDDLDDMSVANNKKTEIPLNFTSPSGSCDVSYSFEGNNIKIDYIRDNKKQSVIITLKNRSGNTNVVKNADTTILGATFKEIDKRIAEKFNLKSGLQIDTIDKDGALAKAGLKKDFIILKINVLSNHKSLIFVYKCDILYM